MEILILLGSLYFWGVLAFLIALMTLVNLEKGGWATTIIFITAIFFWYFEKDEATQAFNYVIANPLSIVVYTVIYLAIGVAWSFIKLYLLAKEKKKNDDREVSSSYVYAKKRTGEAFTESESIPKATPPDVSEFATDIIRWISYWPFSMLWTLIDDPFRKLVNFVYHSFAGGYQKVINAVYK